jgi:hypothetical protein
VGEFKKFKKIKKFKKFKKFKKRSLEFGAMPSGDLWVSIWRIWGGISEHLEA